MRKNSFTLLEILIVIGIIAILAALTVGGLQFAGDKSDEAKTRAIMKEFEMALEKYKSDKGTYPIIKDPNEVVFSSDDDSSPYKYWEKFRVGKYLGGNLPEVKENNKHYFYLKDGYDNSFWYCYPGKKNKGKYDLWSMGPDGKHGNGSSDADKAGEEGSDDICNWRQ